MNGHLFLAILHVVYYFSIDITIDNFYDTTSNMVFGDMNEEDVVDILEHDVPSYAACTHIVPMRA